MRLERAKLREALRALCAAKWPLTSVSPLMRVKIRLEGELLRAVGAGVRLGARVHLQMVGQGVGPRECHGALRALVGLVVGVGADDVARQAGFPREALPAGGALEGLVATVRQQVPLQLPRVREHPLADRAAEGAATDLAVDSGVDPEVSHQVPLLGEVEATDRAAEGPLVGVGPHVDVQLVLVPPQLVAGGALEVPMAPCFLLGLRVVLLGAAVHGLASPGAGRHLTQHGAWNSVT